MTDKIYKQLQEGEAELDRINRQRKLWLIASSGVFVSIMLFIFFKDWVIWLQTTILWWVIVSLMLLVSLNWWYWTMKVIRRLLANHETEYNLIRLLILELKEIRQQVAELKKE
jgi:hypothetical protein